MRDKNLSIISFRAVHFRVYLLTGSQTEEVSTGKTTLFASWHVKYECVALQTIITGSFYCTILVSVCEDSWLQFKASLERQLKQNSNPKEHSVVLPVCQLTVA